VRFQALSSSSLDPRVNLALEECLLGAPLGFEAVLFLYVNAPCLVLGRNQNPWAEISPGAGLPVLRRISGGGTVYHDQGNLNWALLLPRSRHDPEAELGSIAAALRDLGITASPGPRGGLFVDEPSPFAGRKLSGTARRLEAARVLHHGTLLVNADLGRLASSLGGIPLALPKALASVPGRPANLGELLPGLKVEELAAALATKVAGGPSPLPIEGLLAGPGWDRARFDAVRERLGSWEWNYGATPAFTVTVDGQQGRLLASLRSGRLASLEGAGAERVSQLLGSNFDYDTPLKIKEIIDLP